jgi:uncharacterized protein YpmB
METLAKSDIFFFITSIAVVILTVLLSIALVYAIKILREAKKLTAEAKIQGEALLADIDDARRYLKREGMRLGSLAGLAGRFLGGKRRGRKSEGSEKDEL